MGNYYVAPKSAFDATADAIREKTGSQATIEWTEDGFADAVDAIPSGSGADFENLVSRTITSVDSSSITEIGKYAFYECRSLISVNLPEVITIKDMAFRYTGLTAVSFPKCTTIYGQIFNGTTSLTSVNFPALQTISGNGHFTGTSITVLALPALIGAINGTIQNCALITTLDLGVGATAMNGNAGFQNCAQLNTIILRRSSSLVSVQSAGAFTGTPFASGGTGGTIYIPKVLYDHLGDNTSLDYKAATNWSTVDGYGTITWAKIEGSQYENYYADGTSIPTT